MKLPKFVCALKVDSVGYQAGKVGRVGREREGEGREREREQRLTLLNFDALKAAICQSCRCSCSQLIPCKQCRLAERVAWCEIKMKKIKMKYRSSRILVVVE